MSASLAAVVNPTAGGGRLRRHRCQLEGAAAALGVELEWWATEGPGHATELARRAVAEERPLLLACGGDGTYNEVARGLLGSSTALAVIPGGTTSVLAYELNVPRPPVRSLDALLAGVDRPMRVGRTSSGDIVLLMVSAGPDALVLRRLRPALKRLGGRLGVAAEAVLELAVGGRLPRLRAHVGGETLDGGWAIVGKSRCYAGRFEATPFADPFRATLELLVQRRSGRRAATGFLLALARGTHLRRRDVHRAEVERVMLEPDPPGSSVPYQIDGDPVGELPVEVWVDPSPLLVRLPTAVGDGYSPSSAIGYRATVSARE